MGGKHNHCELSQKAVEWINGELLGDGCLQSRSKCSAQFKYGSKYLEYINYVSNTLNSFGIIGEKIRKRPSRFTHNYVYFYRSFSYIELLAIQKQFYPKSKKIIPRDIKFTPLTLRQWYIGDGCLEQPRKASPHICLCTQGFTILDNNWIIKQLINLGFKTTRQPAHNTVSISVYSTKEFLEYIGSCPVECYKYKWDY